MGKQELISIIIPIYNVEKYLNRCIRSVVDQTYKNLEIILVDDGSPDNCPGLCDEWAQKDSRIKVIHKANGGLSDARNAGMESARGIYIGFIDSDDYIAPNMYEELYKALKLENADLAICNYERIWEENGQRVEAPESPVKNETFTGKDGLKKITEGDWGYYVTAVNRLYTRKALGDITFPVGKINEDQFVAHRIYFQCDKIVSINQKLYTYVLRKGSIMTSSRGVKRLDDIEALCQRFEFYKKHGLTGYYTDLSKVLKEEYIKLRYDLPKVSETADKKRVREIDKMFKTTYFECAPKITLKEKIEFTVPSAWFFYNRVRQKCFRK